MVLQLRLVRAFVRLALLFGSSRASNWHLHPLNTRAAWARGYTGKGVVVVVVDDGLEWTHPALLPNYDKEASVDLVDGDADPAPDYSTRLLNSHGTRCAGVIAASAKTTGCAIGIAFEAGIGGIRLLGA
jgi:subtilisin family serine protease